MSKQKVYIGLAFMKVVGKKIEKNPQMVVKHGDSPW